MDNRNLSVSPATWTVPGQELGADISMWESENMKHTGRRGPQWPATLLSWTLLPLVLLSCPRDSPGHHHHHHHYLRQTATLFLREVRGR